MKKRKCCDVVYFKHDMGWDAYLKQDCHIFGNAWVPRWFDCAIIEDVPTRKQIQKEIHDMHFWGLCLVTS